MKKYFAGMSALFCVLSLLLCGCNQQSSPVSSSVAGSNTNSTDNSASTSNEEEVKFDPANQAAFDFNDTIKVLAWWSLAPTSDTEFNQKMVESLARVKDKYNCDIEFLVMDTDTIVPQMTAAAMSGEVLADVILMRHTWAFPYLAKGGYLMDIGEFLHTDEKMYNQSVLDIATVDGKLYGFNMGYTNTESVVYYNKAIFERYNLPSPQTYYENNDWTWERFGEICAQAKQEVNGEVTLWGSGFLDYGKVEMICNTYGGEVMKYEDGVYKSLLVSQPNIDAITMIHKLTHVDKVCEPRPNNAPWDYDIQQFVDGKYAMTVNAISALKKFYTGMDDKYGIVPLPRGGSATKHVNFVSEVQAYTVQATMSRDRAAKVLQIMEDYFSPYNLPDEEVRVDSPYVYDRTSQQVINDLSKNTYVSSARGINEYYTLLLKALVDGATGVKSPSAALTEVDSAWEKAINDNLNSKS